MEEKVDNKPNQGDIYGIKLNQWLQELEVYFCVHNLV